MKTENREFVFSFNFSFLSSHFSVLLNLFLNFPSRSLSHSRHSSIAFSRSARELAGLKFNQVEVASRRHISAKKRVCKSSDESSSISSSIEFRAVSRRIPRNSSLFIPHPSSFIFSLTPSARARRRPRRRCILAEDKSIRNLRRKFRANPSLR